MSSAISRRDILKQLGAVGAGAVFSGGIFRGQDADILVAGHPVEIVVASVSASTVRISVLPIEPGRSAAVPLNGGLAQANPGERVLRARNAPAFKPVEVGDLIVRFTDGPPTLQIETNRGAPVQTLTLDATASDVTFALPRGPLLGLGEGGPQFDRKGSVDQMRSGQGGYRLRTHGGRAPLG